MAIMANITTGSKKNSNYHSKRNGNNENSYRTVNIVNNNHNNNNINKNKNKKKQESNSGEWKSRNVPMSTKYRNGLNPQAQECISINSINNSHSLNNRAGYQSSRKIHASNAINAVNCYGSPSNGSVSSVSTNSATIVRQIMMLAMSIITIIMETTIIIMEKVNLIHVMIVVMFQVMLI